MGKKQGGSVPIPEITMLRCNCVPLYRQSIILRRLLFQLYEQQGKFSFGQFVGFMTVLYAAQDKVPARLKGVCDELWELWGELRPKLAHRTPSDSTLVLYADTFILFLCPNAYVHLLRDALTLRLGKYKTRTERLIHLKDCIKWAELTSKRVWLNTYNKEPEKPSKDWWQRIARSQVILASNHHVYPILGQKS